jgi:hypothetical protein
LDAELNQITCTSEWNTAVTEFNTRESYAEFMSIILHSVYLSIGYTTHTADDIIKKETEYSLSLVANILKFYDHDETNYLTFFTRKRDVKRIDQPCLLWEYVFLRSVYMIHYKTVIEMVLPSLVITPTISESLVKLIKNTKIQDYIKDHMKYPIRKNMAYIHYSNGTTM